MYGNAHYFARRIRGYRGSRPMCATINPGWWSQLRIQGNPYINDRYTRNLRRAYRLKRL